MRNGPLYSVTHARVRPLQRPYSTSYRPQHVIPAINHSLDTHTLYATQAVA